MITTGTSVLDQARRTSSVIASRFSFWVAVSSPSSWSSSLGIKRNFLICSTEANFSLVSLTTSWISSTTSGFSEGRGTSCTGGSPQRPVADRVVLDADQGGEVLAAVADRPSPP